MKIGYFGDPGAYSNIAATHMAQGEFVPLDSVRSVFNSLQSGDIGLGVVPIENSIEGAVNQTYDFLFKMDAYIIKEYYLRINHCLIGFPDASLKEIKYVHSHPQALAQCSDYLYSHGMKPVSEYDTAGSVKIIKEQETKNHAAIASEIAAKLNQMEILERDIENNKYNYTRFFLLSREPSKLELPSKTSLVFSTENKPGSLFKILKIFDQYKINMTKIESRPVQYNPFTYLFFIDIENNENSEIAIKEIEGITSPFKVLGNYKIASITKN
ncbi:prephenate dehydratase [Ferroplasma sp.]|uniref:prephenate dehydratase n=1 Tax=Ferroplasma sp. TaxID=2591003 RepID=UPI00307E0BD4